ncbi:MAG TPA: CXXX repeat peptide modification system protein [Rikenellaceae bacterium]|nr:CXXX repeat peptide modification system protein [Rikenellaceae bacterium]
MKTLVGKVSAEEREVIQALFERKNGLTELAKIVSVENAPLYEKLVKDMGETATRFQKWWDEMSAKYEWRSAANGHWEIDFDTCEIYLNEP